ncbi:MAG: hypothetical protein Q9218_002485 [Villophora microphyllina]
MGKSTSIPSTSDEKDAAKTTLYTIKLDNLDGIQGPFTMTNPDKAMKISGAQALLGYIFNDPAPLWEALQAAGPQATTLDGKALPKGNMRLALLGDAVLKTALLEGWYRTPGSTEDGHNVVLVTAGNIHLANVGNHLGLGKFIKKNTSQGTMVSTRVMTATVEAIIGAVFLDSHNDLSTVRQVMENLGLVAPAAGT